MKYTELCSAVQNEIAQVLNSIDENKLNKFVELITRPGVKILGYSAGRMGFGLKAFLMRLNHLGISAYWFGDNYIPPMNENDVLNEKWNQGAIINLVNKQGYSFDKAKELFMHVWLYSNGLATLIATNEIKLDDKEIITRIVKIYKVLAK